MLRVSVSSFPGHRSWSGQSRLHGELKSLIYNFGKQPYTVKPGDKIAQVIFEKITQRILTAEVNQVTEQVQGDKSFGCRGK